MLGGLDVDDIDIKGSHQFVKTLPNLGTTSALGTPYQLNVLIDCGCGIGRITKNLLSNLFTYVDLCEQNAGFIEQSRIELKELYLNNRIRNVHVQSLVLFDRINKYDVIWCQWVLAYLNDRNILCKNYR